MLHIKNFQVILAIFIFGAILVILVYNFQNNFEAEKLEQSSNWDEPYDVELKNLPIEDSHVKKILSQCGIDKHCTVESLQELAKLENKKTVLSAVNDILLIYEETGYYCHENGHHLGMFVYGFIGNLSESISSVERRCGGSVYHGMIENFFVSSVLLKNQKVEDLKIANICDKDFGPDITKIECLHGVGHGLIKSYNYDYTSALNRCDEFAPAQYCYNGVAMEYSEHYKETNIEFLNGYDIIQFCSSLDEKYQQTCYQYQAFNILISKNLSTKESLAICDTIENNKEIEYCYYGIGTQIFAFFNDNLEKMATECQLGKPDYQKWCIWGSETVILDQLGIDKGFDFCKIIPEKFKSDCYIEIGVWARSLFSSDEEIKIVCSAAENEKYYDECITKIHKIKCSGVFILPDNTTIDITDKIGCGLQR